MGPIKSACVRWKKKGSKEYNFIDGYCHDECYNYISCCYNEYPRVDDRYDVEEGFLTVDGQFVNRSDAVKVAKENNQMLPGYNNVDKLCSQMIFYKE